MKKYLQFALDYMRLFVPGALQNLLDEVAREAYQDGWEHGFDIGHRRGWLQLRSKLTKAQNKYPHEKCLDRSEA